MMYRKHRIKKLEKEIIKLDERGRNPRRVGRILNRIYHKVDAISPQYLYKFRSFEEKHINSLVEDKLYLSIPANFNDPTESMAYVDPNNVVNYGMNLPESFFGGFNDEQDNDDPYHLFQRVDFMNLCINYVEAIRQRVKVCCLSEGINSNLMWSHYAKDHTGFAIRYEVPQIDIPECKCCSIAEECYCRRPGKPIFPVIYKSKRYDASMVAYARALYISKDLQLEQWPTVEDMPVPLLSVIQKQTCWSYEKEWRLICFNKDMQYLSLKADAIYLGEEISCENALKLSRIAKEKNINLYKMEIDYLSPEFPLSYDEWTDYTEEDIQSFYAEDISYG